MQFPPITVRLTKGFNDHRDAVARMVKALSHAGITAEFTDGTTRWQSGPTEGVALSMSRDGYDGTIDGAVTPERRRELLSMSAFGRDVLTDEDQLAAGRDEGAQWQREQLRARGHAQPETTYTR